jgi:hypothetical protein
MTRVTEMIRQDLERRRDEILRALGVSYTELEKRANAYSLVGDERAAWNEIREIEFLLADDVA